MLIVMKVLRTIHLLSQKIIILNSMNYYQYWKNIMEEAGVQVI